MDTFTFVVTPNSIRIRSSGLALYMPLVLGTAASLAIALVFAAPLVLTIGVSGSFALASLVAAKLDLRLGSGYEVAATRLLDADLLEIDLRTQRVSVRLSEVSHFLTRFYYDSNVESFVVMRDGRELVLTRQFPAVFTLIDDVARRWRIVHLHGNGKSSRVLYNRHWITITLPANAHGVSGGSSADDVEHRWRSCLAGLPEAEYQYQTHLSDDPLRRVLSVVDADDAFEQLRPCLEAESEANGVVVVELDYNPPRTPDTTPKLSSQTYPLTESGRVPKLVLIG